jgi:hypothetical protein
MAQIATPDRSHTYNSIEGKPDMDLAKVQLNRLEMQALMQSPPDTIVTYNGRLITAGEALGRILRGDGVEITPAQPAPAQPGQPAGPNIRISQEAVNALSEQQYQELKETGHLQGLTNTDNGRCTVRVSRGGSIEVHRAFNPETGTIEPGRPLDLRHFYDPAAETK